MKSPRSCVAPDEAGFGRLAPAAALPGGEGAMALPWLQRVELVLFAAAFLCGAVAAAALTRTQVRRRDGAGSGGGASGGRADPDTEGPLLCGPGLPGPGGRRSAAEVHRR